MIMALLWWLFRPVSGGLLLDDWAKMGALPDVPRHGPHPPLMGNGWYALADYDELEDGEELVVHARGRLWGVEWAEPHGESKPRVRLICCAGSGTCDGRRCAHCGNDGIVAESLVDVVLGVIFVWWHADNEMPFYRIGDFANQASVAGLVSHGKMIHHVRALQQDIPENGADGNC